MEVKYKQMAEHSELYTAEDLAEIATHFGLELSTLQVGEWHRAGLLPSPVRPPGPKKRGRPRLYFPEPTPRAACSLARWRKRVSGDDNARAWLWLEGFDYIELDPDREMAAWIEREWSGYRKTCPSLPESPDTPIDPDRRERILEELDENYTGPESEKHGVPVEWLAMHPALLGLFSEKEWRGLERLGVGEPPSEVKPSEKLMAGLYESGKSLLGGLPYSKDEMLTDATGDPGLFALLSLPGLARISIDWACVRAMWQFVCIVTNISEAPMLAEQVVFPGWRRLARWLRKYRYYVYSHYEPWYVAAILAMVSNAIPDELRREIVRAVQDVRRSQEQDVAVTE